MLTKEEIENLLVINDEKLDEEVSEQTRELIDKVEKQLEERGCDDIYHDLVTELLIKTQDEAYKIGLRDGSHFEEIQTKLKGDVK